MTRAKPRQGYAMLFVLVFIALMLSLYSLAHRHISTALYLESARTVRRQHDEGATHALAKALELLETGLPPKNTYACTTTMDTSQGPRSFTVIFKSKSKKNWIVQVRPSRPTENLPSIPVSFAR